MRNLALAIVMGAGSLGLAVQTASAQPASATAAAERVVVPGHRYTAEELEAQRTAVLAVDAARFEALKRGDRRRLETLVAIDAKFIDGLATGADQVLDRERFLDRVRTTRPPRSFTQQNRTVRMFGVEDDVVILNGEVRDANVATAGGIYTAIYLRTYERSWELVRYQISPFVGNVGIYASEPGRAWDVEALSPSQRRVMDTLRVHFDAMARRDDAALERTIGDEFWYIRGGAPEGNQHGKADYMAFKRVNKGAPEIVGVDEPQISFYGNYGEVAVVNGVRRDATGGAVFGPTFDVKWRTLANYTAVVLRPSTREHVWVMQHYHASYIIP